MSNLFVITFKRPALDIEKSVYGEDFTHAYDCEACFMDQVAQIKFKDALNRYEDVKMFQCDEADYLNFVKNEDAYLQFVKTGEHTMTAVDKDPELAEDVDVGTDSHTEVIDVILKMERQNDEVDFGYSVNIDDVGQIVFTPDDPVVSFIDIVRKSRADSNVDTLTGNQRVFPVQLTANMIAEDNNFEYFLDIDEVGQAVITPDVESTSFLTVSVNDSLNLVTESAENLIISEDIDELDRHTIIDRFMKGEIAVFSDDGEPSDTYIHLNELDSKKGKVTYEYYYDQESDAIVSYCQPTKE